MEIAAINTALHRDIRKGDAFNKYFPKSSCKSVRLGTGNTKLAIEEMAKWVHKYSDHSKRIADEYFSKFPIAQLPARIHDFLFNHIQYNIDVYDQNLKSPACSWQTRSKGADCKSFSIFASTILWNLGIKHYLRRVKQPSIYPDSFTHVYVVIPKDQRTGRQDGGYYVIDATLRINKEVDFIQKDDIYMEPNLPIYGLAAPSQTVGLGAALACACQENAQAMASVGPNYAGQSAISLGAGQYRKILGFAVEKFNNYIAALKILSPDSKGVEQFRSLVYAKLATGHDPKLQFTKTGVYVDDQYVNLSDTFAKLSGVRSGKTGLALDPVTVSAILSATQTTNPDGTTTPLDPSKFLSSLTKIIPTDFFNSTFGAVFANGFNLSCWNSTFTPSEVAAEVQKIHVPFFERILAKASGSTSDQELVTNFNFLLKSVDISYDMYAVKLPAGANWRSCSKEAIQIYTDIVTGAKVQTDILLENLKKNVSVTETTASVPAKYTYPASLTNYGKDFTWSESQHGNATYRIIKLNGSLFNEIQNTIDNALKDKNTPGVQQAGMSGLGMLILGGVIIGGLVYGTKQFSKSGNKPKTKK